MTARSTAGIMAGERWELRPGYHNPRLTRRAAKQGHWLMRQTCSAIGQRRSLASPLIGEWLQRRTTVHLPESRHNQTKPTLDAYPEIMAAVPDLLSLIARSRVETGDHAGYFNLLKQWACGRGPRHIDHQDVPIADNSLISELEGIALATIEDPQYGLVEVSLLPGDALYIDNSGPRSERLEHQVRNGGFKPRLSAVD